uniref:carbon-nitrogen hydrolase family protein n=1 Tax=uncultured Erythrobacter sp. TaxID=263913 RepID=UPI00261C6327|nr:carbon-nitrogen hydrolase family protein [uncultured Erythrobacter sp.]
MPKIAVLQMNSGVHPPDNHNIISQAIVDASSAGAEVIFTPEMSVLLDRDRKRSAEWVDLGYATNMANDLANLAYEFKIDIALGSAPVKAGERWANRSMYFSRNAPVDEAADPVIYDKIHMFDVELSTGETWRESGAYQPGERVVTLDDTPLGRLGLTICYDIRFPALFEELGKRKCDAIATPAAFTKPTGAAHWHVMLRARAIEASAFVIAAAQVGKHEDGRETYGHSLVVDPWGEVLIDMGGEEPGLAFCDIDLGRIGEVREQVPSIANKREIPN